MSIKRFAIGFAAFGALALTAGPATASVPLEPAASDPVASAAQPVGNTGTGSADTLACLLRTLSGGIAVPCR
ncbi:hypothetical protein [Nocardia transvalensis]|uniref:hypothetical protein n=1 Tax=Nocardia transvalensis TaxID=37333 RepID=UPI00189485B7|nr:hypothetical protein [Nocardia transvalensis]MBF6332719.1 hypothetical protein [Nocardia transvalensis]